MSAPATVGEFLELVRKSRTLDTNRLLAYLQRLGSTSNPPGDPASLARYLVRDGFLTLFQARHLLQGKWRGFYLGNYKVLERLGTGGMGCVYLCEHQLLRRRVAVKVLLLSRIQDPRSLQCFYREARAIAALDHPNIVRAYDFAEEAGLHYLVMEHVDGSSLHELIRTYGPLEVARAAHYIRQAALGLQHAYERAALVHRDIKPSNILVDRHGTVKILDLGLVRFSQEDEDLPSPTYPRSVLGTADYIAPEQTRDSQATDIRADIYSLGATFYFCLAGRPPFEAGTLGQKLIWQQTRQPKPIRSLCPQVPAELAAVVEKMMAKDPARRFQVPREVAEALTPWTPGPRPHPPGDRVSRLNPTTRGARVAGGGISSPGALASSHRVLIPRRTQLAHQ
jgi:serine/threonine protein kinase